MVRASKAVIRLYSGENYERMRGLYFDGVVSDEDADIPPQAFDYVILPSLLDYEGRNTRNGTPKGKNAFYKAFVKAQSSPDSFALMLKASESGILSESALAALRSQLTAEAYAQEMECDFNVGSPGAIYARLIEAAYREKRIVEFPVADTLVHTTWDLGSPSNTTVWYWQIAGREIRVIESQPSFKQGFYWMKLTEIIGYQVLPTNQATLRTIYTLISCNFNSADFVQYVIQSYGQALPPETDATDYWAEHIRLINGIAEEPGMIMDPLMPGCKTMLFTAMDKMIQSYRYSPQTERRNLAVLNLPTALNGAELALWQRLEIEAKMKPVDIIRDHLRKIAQVYGTDSKPLNDGYLYEKYYKIDASRRKDT